MLTGVIEYRGMVPSELSKRELNGILRAGFHQLGVYWVANFRAKHFTNAGATEYGYAPREGERGRPGPRGFRQSYTGRKLRKKGHTRPLVYTGQSEQMTRAARVQASSANMKSSVRVVMRAPRLNFKRGNIDMRSELTRISAKEQTILTRLLGRYISSRFRALGLRQSVPIGGFKGGAGVGIGSGIPGRDALGRFVKKAS